MGRLERQLIRFGDGQPGRVGNQVPVIQGVVACIMQHLVQTRPAFGDVDLPAVGGRLLKHLPGSGAGDAHALHEAAHGP